MKKITSILLITLLFIGLTSFNDSEVPVSKKNWVTLGSRTATKGADHDEILVTAAKGLFRKLKFKVTRSPVHVTNVKVVYANGSSENHIINKRFNAGEHSRVLDLKGGKRIIRKIVFNYRTKIFAKGRARIIVFGKH
jgi:hypothetical protein